MLTLDRCPIGSLTHDGVLHRRSSVSARPITRTHNLSLHWNLDPSAHRLIHRIDAPATNQRLLGSKLPPSFYLLPWKTFENSIDRPHGYLSTWLAEFGSDIRGPPFWIDMGRSQLKPWHSLWIYSIMMMLSDAFSVHLSVLVAVLRTTNLWMNGYGCLSVPHYPTFLLYLIPWAKQGSYTDVALRKREFLDFGRLGRVLEIASALTFGSHPHTFNYIQFDQQFST